MIEVLKSLAAILNELHNLLSILSGRLGLSLSDKQLHFWIFGLCGLGLFIITDMAFKQLAKWTISALSFIYAFTLLVILTLSVEIQQKLTQQGAMQFSDLLAGLWGFLVMFSLYTALIALIRFLSERRRKRNHTP